MPIMNNDHKQDDDARSSTSTRNVNTNVGTSSVDMSHSHCESMNDSLLVKLKTLNWYKTASLLRKLCICQLPWINSRNTMYWNIEHVFPSPLQGIFIQGKMYWYFHLYGHRVTELSSNRVHLRFISRGFGK